jgi:hypothetical protein
MDMGNLATVDAAIRFSAGALQPSRLRTVTTGRMEKKTYLASAEVTPRAGGQNRAEPDA